VFLFPDCGRMSWLLLHIAACVREHGPHPTDKKNVDKFPRRNVYTKKNMVSIDGKGKLRINITSISTRCGYFAGGENLNCVRNQVVGGPFIAADDDTPSLRCCIPVMWVINSLRRGEWTILIFLWPIASHFLTCKLSTSSTVTSSTNYQISTTSSAM
jgi:hypothetical protein